MNDDCILEILKYLNGEDLCSVAHVCAHLQLLARMAYSSNKEGDKELTLVHDNDKWKASRTQLRTFGIHQKSIRFVSVERNHRCTCSDTGLECFTYLSSHTENLEHLEIDMLSHVLKDTFFHEISKFSKLKSLKVYSVYNCGVVFGIEMLDRLPKLTELVWGYPAIFGVKDLKRVVHIGQSLEQVVVICHSGIYAIDRELLTAEIYQEMLSVVKSRASEKPLEIIIMGCETFLRRFKIDFPTDESLKITCVKKKAVTAALNIEVISLNSDVKISAEILESLRVRGVIPR